MKNEGIIYNYGNLSVNSSASYVRSSADYPSVINEGGTFEGIPSKYVLDQWRINVTSEAELLNAITATKDSPNILYFIYVISDVAISQDLLVPYNAELCIWAPDGSDYTGSLTINGGATLYSRGRIVIAGGTLAAYASHIVIDTPNYNKMWDDGSITLHFGSTLTLYPGGVLNIGTDDTDSCEVDVTSDSELRQYGNINISRYSSLVIEAGASITMYNGSNTAVDGTFRMDGIGQCDEYGYITIGDYGQVIGTHWADLFYYSPGTVSIAGAATIGSTLSIKGTGLATGSRFYQWYANGSEISGATSSTYTIPTGQGMAGKRISGSITVSGYNSIFSPPTSPVAKATSIRPSNPILQKSTHTSVDLQPVTSAKYICTTSSAVPAINDSGWQDSNVFTGLSPSTTYYFFLYIPATADYNVSPVSGALSVKTLAPPVESIVISGPQAVAAGKSIQLSAEVLPTNAGNKTLSWQSSDTNVATVSSGKVTAKSVTGTQTVTITASATDGSGISDTYEITVTPVAAAVIISKDGNTVTGQTIGIDLGLADKTIQLSAAIKPDDASQGVTWSSSNSGVATVTHDGLVTGIAKGTATITATATDGSGTKASVTVNVATLVKDISITGPNEVAAGKSIQLNASALPADATNKTLAWQSSNVSVATVSSGKVTAKSVTRTQTVTITASATDGSGVSATYDVTVKPAATAVVISRDDNVVTGQTLGIDLGSEDLTIQLSAAVKPGDAGQGVQWTTSSAKVATVTQDGLVTGIARGKATITATATDGTGVRATVTINVATMVQSIVITGPTEVAAKKSIQLATIITPYEATTKSVTWSCSDPAIATVSSTGKVTAKSIADTQTVTITASATDGSGVSATYDVTVKPAATAVVISREDNVVTGQTLGIDLGSDDRTIQLSAAVKPDDAGQGIQWTTSSAKVATVTQDGLVTGIAKGKATITATATDGTESGLPSPSMLLPWCRASSSPAR